MFKGSTGHSYVDLKDRFFFQVNSQMYIENVIVFCNCSSCPQWLQTSSTNLNVRRDKMISKLQLKLK